MIHLYRIIAEAQHGSMNLYQEKPSLLCKKLIKLDLSRYNQFHCIVLVLYSVIFNCILYYIMLHDITFYCIAELFNTKHVILLDQQNCLSAYNFDLHVPTMTLTSSFVKCHLLSSLAIPIKYSNSLLLIKLM